MPLLRPVEAAEALGISVDQLAALTDAGQLPFINVGLGEKRPARRYEPDDIAAFKLQRRQVECPSTSAPAPKPTRTTSKSGAIDLAAIREKLQNAKRSPSRSA